MQANSLILCTPLDIEFIKLISPSLTLLNINFTEDFINAELLPVINTGFIVKEMNDTLINMLISEFESKKPYNLIYQKNLLNLILLDALRKKDTNTSNAEKERINNHSIAHQVAIYIHLHYREPLTLKEISSHFSYTQNHLNKLFQSSFNNMSINQYLCKTRLEQAEKLLTCSDMTVTQICIESGFSSLSTFFRIFKEFHGISPKEYQKKFKIAS